MIQKTSLQIAVLDAHLVDAGDMDWTALRQMGDLTLHPNSSPETKCPRRSARDEVPERIRSAHIVYTNKVKFPASAFDRSILGGGEFF